MNEIVEHLLTSDEKLAQLGYGEWLEEPEEVTWTYKDYQCNIKRILGMDGVFRDGLSLGHLCGYVKVPEDHPFNNKDMNELNELEIDVYGGITFARLNDEEEFWIGFDCAHSGDIIPGHEMFKKRFSNPLLEELEKINREMKEKFPNSIYFNPVYRNIAFAKKECEKLVDELINAKEAKIEEKHGAN